MKQARQTIIMASALSCGILFFGPAEAAQPPEIDLSSFYAARLGIAATADSQRDTGPSGSTSTSNPIMVALADTPEIPSSQLATMRGGFELPGGISVAFGLAMSTLLQNQGAAPSIIQTLTINGTASGSSVNGQITQTNNGISTTSQLTPGSGPIIQQAVANNGATNVLTTMTKGGFSTLIQNTAANQMIQHMQTVNLDIYGLNHQLSQQASSFAAISSALLHANSLNHR